MLANQQRSRALARHETAKHLWKTAFSLIDLFHRTGEYYGKYEKIHYRSIVEVQVKSG
jgi:hypothetical protein